MAHYISLAEAFARGLMVPEYPSDEVIVSYYSRVYPELDLDGLLKAAAIENIQAEDGSFDFRNPNVAEHCYGWTISLDYNNEEKHEIIHRTEITRSSKAELKDALLEYDKEITNPRQRKVFIKWRNDHLDRYDEALA